MHRLTLTDIEDRVLGALLPAQAEHNGDAPWLLVGDDRFTFADGHRRVEALAAGLAGLGIGRGDIVALMLENSADYVFLVLALVRLGAVHVPINTAFVGEYLRRLLEHASPRTIIVDEALGERLSPLLAGLAVEHVVVRGAADAVDLPGKVLAVEELRHAGGSVPAHDVAYSDTVAILYTSGTTGRAKGAMQSHHYWYTATEAMAAGRDIRADDVFHLCTPMFHAGAWLLNLYPSLLYGLPVGVEGWFSVTDYWDSVRRYGATQLFTLGAMHMWLWSQPAAAGDADQPGRVWTAVPLAGELWQPFKDRFGLDGVFSAYGQTEIMPAATADIRRPAKPGVGRLGPAEPRAAGGRRARPGTARRPARRVGGAAQDTGEHVLRLLQDARRDRGRLPEPLVPHRRPRPHRRATASCSSSTARPTTSAAGARTSRRFEVEEIIRRHPAVADVAVHARPRRRGRGRGQGLRRGPARGGDLTPPSWPATAPPTCPTSPFPATSRSLDELPRTPTGRVQKFVLRERGVTDATWDRVAAGFEVRSHHQRSGH